MRTEVQSTLKIIAVAKISGFFPRQQSGVFSPHAIFQLTMSSAKSKISLLVITTKTVGVVYERRRLGPICRNLEVLPAVV